MLNEIKIKEAASFLGALKNKVVGSNKSKANLSIIDRIRKYYLELSIDNNEVELEKLEQEKVEIQESLDDYKEKLDQETNPHKNGPVVRLLEREIKFEEKNQKKNNDSIENVKETLKEKNEKLNKILEKEAAVMEPIKEEVSLEDTSKNLEAEADKVAYEEKQDVNVENELKAVEEEIKKNVNEAVKESKEEPTVQKEETPVQKEETEIVKDEMVERVNQFIEKYNEDIITLSNTLIQEISVAYEQKLQQQAASYEAKLKKQAEEDKEKINKMANETEKALVDAGEKIKVRDNKINELTTTNGALTANLESANKTIVEKDNKINELTNNVTSLNSTIEANKVEMEAKDKEIERLKLFENYYVESKALEARLNASVGMEQPSVDGPSKTR